MSGTTASGQDQLRIFRPESGGIYRLVAESNFEAVTMDPAGMVRTFTTSIPVQGGDHLGMQTGNPSGDAVGMYATANANDVAWNPVGNPQPVVGQTVGPGSDFPTYGINSPARANVAATLFKPDVSADTVAPETTIAGGPGKKLADRKAKFRFTSNEANATFLCKLDKKAFQPCTSPKRYKNLAPGKHKFQVQATDASANVDGTPAKKKFSVPD